MQSLYTQQDRTFMTKMLPVMVFDLQEGIHPTLYGENDDIALT